MVVSGCERVSTGVAVCPQGAIAPPVVVRPGSGQMGRTHPPLVLMVAAGAPGVILRRGCGHGFGCLAASYGMDCDELIERSVGEGDAEAIAIAKEDFWVLSAAHYNLDVIRGDFLHARKVLN